MSKRSPEYDQMPDPTKADERREVNRDAASTSDTHKPRLDEGNLQAARVDRPDASVEGAARGSNEPSTLDEPRNDTQLYQAVVQALEGSADVDDVDIEVLVHERGVMLNGTVPSRAMIQAAEKCVRSVPGVKGVTNNLAPLMGGKIKFTGSSAQRPSASP